jgi:peptidoglycan/xylan/chitin deacetylase (PgdA/CDA1 family)
MVRNSRAASAFLCAVLALAGCGSPPNTSKFMPIAHRVTGQGGGQPEVAEPDRVKPASVVLTPPDASPSASASAGTSNPNNDDAAPSRRSNRPATEPPPPPYTPPPPGKIRHRTDSGAVTLTFDDGPSPYTPQILALLRANGVKATFCVIGVNVRAHPDFLRAIVADGHTLCNHTWSHDLKLGTKSSETIRADLERTNDEIHRAVPGVAIKYFRHPGGNFTPRAVAIAAELGMESDSWDVDPWDWNTKAYPAGSTMINHVVKVVERDTRAGSIILSHDGGGDRSSTIAAYRTLIPWLKERFDLQPLP